VTDRPTNRPCYSVCNNRLHLFTYTVSQKHVQLWIALILTYTIRLRSFLAEVLLRWCFVFPPHLSSALALPCERENPEHIALVFCACNTVQLLQRSRLPFSWTIPSKSPKLNVWLQDLGSHTAAWVWVVSQKDWRNQPATGWILAMHYHSKW